jgi:hypothetical protein
MSHGLTATAPARRKNSRAENSRAKTDDFRKHETPWIVDEHN